MKKFKYVVAAFLACILFAAACKHTPPEVTIPDPPIGGGGGTGTTTVCFETEILPLFQSNCAKSGCHDASTHTEGYVFDSYQNIIREDIIPGNAANSEVYEVLFESGNDKMPPAPNPDLTAAQKALIGRWINEGALNTTNCGTTCDTSNFKYSTAVSVITSAYCVGCHAGSAPSAGINLSSYAGVAAAAQSGRLYNAITHTAGYSPMPKNAAKLSDCQITQVRKWIQSGTPNN
jgi:uncharacterized membrane protein